MSTLVLDKKADLAGPGIGDYLELEKILPKDYRSLLTPKETQQAACPRRITNYNRSITNINFI